jgi:hypothetical protein
MRFLTSSFFYESTLYSPRIHTQNIFEFSFEFTEILVFKVVLWGVIPRRTPQNPAEPR